MQDLLQRKEVSMQHEMVRRSVGEPRSLGGSVLSPSANSRVDAKTFAENANREFLERVKTQVYLNATRQSH